MFQSQRIFLVGAERKLEWMTVRGKKSTYLFLDSFSFLILCHLTMQTSSEPTAFARVHLHYFSVKGWFWVFFVNKNDCNSSVRDVECRSRKKVIIFSTDSVSETYIHDLPPSSPVAHFSKIA